MKKTYAVITIVLILGAFVLGCIEDRPKCTTVTDYRTEYKTLYSGTLLDKGNYEYTITRAKTYDYQPQYRDFWGRQQYIVTVTWETGAQKTYNDIDEINLKPESVPNTVAYQKQVCS